MSGNIWKDKAGLKSLNFNSSKTNVTSTESSTKPNPFGYIGPSGITSKRSSKSIQRPSLTKKKSITKVFSSKTDKQTSNSIISDEKKSSVEVIEEQSKQRARKRKMRQQLSLAKMQFKVLKAKLGLEVTQSASIEEDKEVVPPLTPQHSDKSDDHMRSPSVSTNELFTTIESMSDLGTEIKDAIVKVDELMTKVDATQNIKPSDNNIFKNENVELKKQLKEFKTKFEKLKLENKKLKEQISKNGGKKDVRANAPKIVEEEKTDPLVVFENMRKLGMSDDKIIKKMKAQNIDKKLIEKFQNSKGNKDDKGDDIVTYEKKFEKFIKMKKMGMGEFVIVNKMKMDGLSKEEMADFKLGKEAYDKKMEEIKKKNTPAITYEKKFEKFLKMKKMGMNQFTIQNKMKMDGLKADDVKEFEDGPEAFKKKYSTDAKPPPVISYQEKFKKFIKMKKMGMNEFTIWNKMKLDGLTESDLQDFKDGPEAYKKKNEPKVSFDEKFKKYIKMKKMGMPENTITNKMKLDGFDAKDIEGFKAGKEAWEKKDSAPAMDEETKKKLEKYGKMKKMGMPENTIRNKMKMDGISKAIQDDFFGVSKKENNEEKKKEDEVKEEKIGVDKDLEKYYNEYFIFVEKGKSEPMQELIKIMKKDKISLEKIQELKDVINDLPVADVDINIPALKKYSNMIKMGMPKSAVINKMRLDGIDKKLVSAFENPYAKKKNFGDLFRIKRTGKPKLKPKTELKTLHWQKLDKKKAAKTIWNNIDETKIKIDFKEFEYNFSKVDPKIKAAKEKKKKEKKKGGESKNEKKKMMIKIK